MRFGLAETDLPLIRTWLREAGIRWGVDAAHRGAVHLPETGEHTWRQGMRRLLLGYAAAAGDDLVAGLVPCAPAGATGFDAGPAEHETLGRFLTYCEAAFGLRESGRPGVQRRCLGGVAARTGTALLRPGRGLPCLARGRDEGGARADPELRRGGGRRQVGPVLRCRTGCPARAGGRSLHRPRPTRGRGERGAPRPGRGVPGRGGLRSRTERRRVPALASTLPPSTSSRRRPRGGETAILATRTASPSCRPCSRRGAPSS